MTPLKLTIGELTLELDAEGSFTIVIGPTVPTGGLDRLRPFVEGLMPMLRQLQRVHAAIDDDLPHPYPER